MANRETVERAKRLRREMTDVEWRLWGHLRNRQLDGARFRRQHPIGTYIADFICLDKRVIVEVDGSQHADAEQMAHDARRTTWLESQGYIVMRIWANEVDENPEGVLAEILALLLRRRSRREDTPTSPRQG